MSGLVVRIITALASFASLAGFILLGSDGWNDIGPKRWLLLAVAVVALALNLVLEIRAYRQGRARIVQTGEAIQRYMAKLLKDGGRVAIFSRDMTWADNATMRNLLLGKARQGEMTIVVPRMIQIVEDLRAEGADVYTYENLDYSLRSRFTLVQRGTAVPRVAVGRPNGESEVRVEEFSDRTDPVVTLAEDMLEVLERIGRKVTGS